MMEVIGYLASVIIGISLGLIGGGGSILTVPILVYLFGIKPELATSYSLFVVGMAAMVGAYNHYKIGNLKIKPTMYFTVPSILSLLLVRKLLIPMIPQYLFSAGSFEVTKNLLIMIVFAILMVAASGSMIRNPSDKVVSIKPINFMRLAVIGLIVGSITGFLGVGGGFLIIPALIFFARLSMKEAVGTSLLIIFINSVIGFGGDLINGVTINYTLLLSITAIAIVGMFIGTALSKKINGAKLKPAFGWFILIMGLYIIGSEIFFKYTLV